MTITEMTLEELCAEWRRLDRQDRQSTLPYAEYRRWMDIEAEINHRTKAA